MRNKILYTLLSVCLLFGVFIPSKLEAQESNSNNMRLIVYNVVMTETGQILAAEIIGCAGTGGTCLDEVIVEGKRPVPQT